MITRLLIFSSLFCIASVCAEPFECAKLSKAAGTVIRNKTSLQTGSKSRIELTFPDGKVIRLGSNVSFECIPGYFETVLDSGTLLQSTPKGAKRKGIIRAGAVVITGTDFQVSNVEGRNKVIGLNGKTSVQLTANPKAQVGLKPGEMVEVPPGATKMPKAQAINLKTLTTTSTLMKMGPVPSQRAIDANAAKQQPKATFKVGALSPDAGDPAVGLAAGAMQTSTILAQETAGQQQLAQQQAAQEVAVAQQLAASRAFAAQQQQQQQQQEQARQAAAQQQAAQQRAAQGNQGNQGQGPQGNQGQGNQGQGQGGGPQGNQGQGQGQGRQ